MTLCLPLPPPDLHLGIRGCEADRLSDGALSAETGAVHAAVPPRAAGLRSASASGPALRLAAGVGDGTVGLR